MSLPASPTTSASAVNALNRLWPLVLLVAALFIALHNLGGSGPMWPDDSRYANAAAMIHDWIKSDQWLAPYEFAKQNYAQYPEFSLPFHPPGYPGAMALWFVVTGPSYESARLFVAGCYGLAACLIFAIGRRLGASGIAAMLGSLLFLSMPETARWARSTMSEIPALTAFLAGTYCFVRWAQGGRWAWCIAAFALAQFAFFCRVTTTGLMPTWALFLLFRKDFRRLFSPGLIALGVVYLAINFAWVKYVGQFAAHEVLGPGENRADVFSPENLTFYLNLIPDMVGWVTVVLAIVGGILLAIERETRPIALLWMGWFLGYYCFQVSLGRLEQRYFTFALPGLAGLVMALVAIKRVGPVWRTLAPVALVAAIATNAFAVAQIPAGVVGNEALATRLAQTDQPGNVLMASWVDQDLVFRYRSKPRQHERMMIRSDRTLAIRVSDYAHVEPRPLVHDDAGVIDVIKKGRIRYVITATSSLPDVDDRPHDMLLADRAVRASPDQFKLLDTFDLAITWGDSRRHSKLFFWQYLGELPPGASELPVVIPTAGIEYRPDQQNSK